MNKNRRKRCIFGKIGAIFSEKTAKTIGVLLKNRRGFYKMTCGFIRVFCVNLFSLLFLIKKREIKKKEEKKEIYIRKRKGVKKRRTPPSVLKPHLVL